MKELKKNLYYLQQKYPDGELQFYTQKFFFFAETPFYLQSVYMHSANWCEQSDEVLL
jgi:hypothetical protein